MDLQLELEDGTDNPENFLMPLSPSHRPATDNESRNSSPEFAGFFPEPRHKKENTPPARMSPERTPTHRLQGKLLQEAQKVSLKKTPDSAGSATARTTQAAFRRRAAAEWVEQVTGMAVSSVSDHAFRRGLKDGTLLCRVLNHVRPGSVTKIIEPNQVDSDTGNVIQTMENVSNFISALHSLQFPATSIFSIADVESTGWEERPRVAECLLTLKRFYEADRSAAALNIDSKRPFQSSPQSEANLFATERDPTPHSSKPGTSVATPELNYDAVASKFLSRTSGGGTTMGVTRLMQQCTAMLRERMTDDLIATPPMPDLRQAKVDLLNTPDGTLDAMGPVLESVLGSLTQEYEKRLLAKDHEVKAAQHEVKAAQMALKQAQGELYEAHKSLADNANRLPVCGPQPGMTDEERSVLEEMQQREQALMADLDAQESELRAQQQLLREQEAEHSRLMEEFESIQEQAAEYRSMAEKYAVTVEENRRLYNEVQDLKGNIRVFCRIRPLGATGDSSQGCTDEGMDGEVALYNPASGKRKMFKYDRVFGTGSSQEEVYEDTKALIRSVLDGYNVCIFAYGQTGSGKTHTMSGTDVEHMEGRGINYRALDDLFALNEARKGEVEYEIRVQLLEIYNEQLRDLLDDSRSQRRLDIRTTERSGLNVPDAIQLPVACTEDVLEVMHLGASNRAVAETKMNERSSRSHSVLTVMVDGVSKLDGTRSHGCLHLIDLAGSERVGKSEATGDRLEEAKHINRSLSALGDVMAALANKDRHVPFRNSKLTQLLQDSLQGQAKAMMFIHIAPEVSSFGESVSTLAFGSRVSEITLGAAKKNVESSVVLDAREAAGKLQREAILARSEAAAAQEALEAERAELERQRAEFQQLEYEYSRVKAELEARQADDSSPPSPSSNASSVLARAVAPSRPSLGGGARGSTPTARGSSGVGSGIPTPRSAGGATPRSRTPHGRPPLSLDLGRLQGGNCSPAASSSSSLPAKSRIPPPGRTASPSPMSRTALGMHNNSTQLNLTPNSRRELTPPKAAGRVGGLSLNLSGGASQRTPTDRRSMSVLRGSMNGLEALKLEQNTPPKFGSMTARGSSSGAVTARGWMTSRDTSNDGSSNIRRTTSGSGSQVGKAGSVNSSTASLQRRSSSTMRSSMDGGGFGAARVTASSQAKTVRGRWA